MEILNSVKRLLLFLNEHGPGQWVSITNELGRIFEGPAYGFKDPDYTEQIRAFLSGMEDEGLIQLDRDDPHLYNIRAKLTKAGLEHISRLNQPAGPIFYLGQNAHFIYQSPHARTKMSTSNQTPSSRNEPLADKLTRFAKTITGAKAMVIAALSFLTSLGIFFGLWKSDNLPRLSFAAHKSNERLIWPSNLRYIDMDSLPELTSSDLIVIAWLKGHLEDSAVAQKLYVDLKNAGYKPQLVQELAFIDQMKSKCGQFTLQLQLLRDYSRRIQVIINPEFNFFKE